MTRQRNGQCSQPVFTPRNENQIVSTRHEFSREYLADPARSPGNQRNWPVATHAGVPLPYGHGSVRNALPALIRFAKIRYAPGTPAGNSRNHEYAVKI